MIVLDAIKHSIEETIRLLAAKAFVTDPITGPLFSKITSICSSAYKRHGHIIESALVEILKRNDQFVVWREDQFWIPDAVGHMVEGTKSPAELIGGKYNYTGEGKKYLQVDLIVYRRVTKTIASYEVKRGFGRHDSGKQGQMLRDLLCTQVLLQSYGQLRGYEIDHASSHIIFYYGEVPKKFRPYALTGDQLETHFGCPVHAAVEEANTYFRTLLFQALGGL